jgi:hypothetical protein
MCDPSKGKEAMSAFTETRHTAPAPPDMGLNAVIRLVGQTEQRWGEQRERVVQLREQTRGAALAEVRLAEQVLKEIETTLVLARAYRSVLQRLSET